MTKTYTLIAYRNAGYHDRTGRSPSELVQHVFADRQQLIETAAGLKLDNEIASREDWGRREYDFTIYLNGVDRQNWWQIFPYADDEEGSAEAGDDDLAGFDAEIEAAYQRLLSARKAEEAAGDAQRRMDETAEAERERHVEEERELELLARLIEKHGAPAPSIRHDRGMDADVLNDLRAEMSACEQMPGLSVLGHGEMVADRYFELIDHLREGKPLVAEWRLPEWISEPMVLDRLLDDDTMRTYLTYHDCGKPRCLMIDEDGRRRFPDHAAVSERLWRELGGAPAVADLIGLDMEIHTMKDVDVPSFAGRPQAIALMLAGLSEIHANASLFGGIESTRFKMAFKQIDKRGKATLNHLRRMEAENA